MSWTEQKNNRRCDFIDKDIDGIITPEEREEMEGLQKQLDIFRHEKFPLPIEEAKLLYQELLRKNK